MGKLYTHCRRCKAPKDRSKARLCGNCPPSAETRKRRYVVCRHCRTAKPNNANAYCEACKPVLYALQAARRRKRRETVLAHYGGKCACCGETQYEFLQVDHVGGGGVKHLKSIGYNFVSWLLKHGLPEGFRVLCANCNLAIARYPHCPHNPAIKTERKVIPLRASPP